MSLAIIRKCIDELRKDKPEIQYVLGMLEAVEAISDDPGRHQVFSPALQGGGLAALTPVPKPLTAEEIAVREYERGSTAIH